MMKFISTCLKGNLRPASKSKIEAKIRSLSTSNQFNYLKTEIENQFTIGKSICGFTVREVKEIPELQLIGLRLWHDKSGADYFHVARDDSNNVFCIGFRTTPMDSTGVPHILEHSVLCGSQKFPCRDPFFKMLNRSLSTFMNAMTGSDYTIYPFSTQNAVDYRNLMSVYLDAVFKPNLSELDFFQEGWRLEHKDPYDKNSPLIFKGIVFNEMKGIFADSHQLFMQKLQNGILPSHTYGYISGGDPMKIPELTWENLKAFHGKHYHPSNSRIFSYGNFSLESHLSFIDSEYLNHYDKINPNTSVPSELRWTEPRSSHIGCNPDPMVQPNKQTSLAISYLLSDITNDFENFVLSVIGELLIGGPNAPFYKSLIESQLGTSFSPVAGFDGHTYTTTFTIGLQGMCENDKDKVAMAIENTFDAVIEEGFPKERIEAVLHTIELGLKHQTTKFGLGLAINLIPFWNHDGDLIEALKINAKIDKFRKILDKNPSFLQKKIKFYFKNNNHKFILSMSPEDDFEKKLEEAEKKLLETKVRVLNSKDREKMWELGHSLKEKQDLKDDLSSLPSLHVADIPRSTTETPIEELYICDNIPLQLCIQPTNGVSYFNAILSTKGLDKDILNLVPLFCSIMTSMGAGEFDFKAFNQKAELVSGGLQSSFHLTRHPQDICHYEEGIHLSSYSLQKNFIPLLELWTKVLNQLCLDDVSRFETLVKMIATEKANSLVHSGHTYAMTSAAASTSYVSYLNEQVGGLTHLQFMKDISDSSEFDSLLETMKLIAEHVLNKNNIRIALNTASEYSDLDVQSIETFLNSIKGTPSKESPLLSIPSSFAPCTQRIHHIFPFPVNFSAKSFTSLPYTNPDSGPLRVLARLMFQFLHKEIREKGGAYGGGAIAQPGGPFCFYSYRDPHSVRTLKTFDDAVEWVLGENFTEQDVNEAKIGVFQSVDSPVSPGSKGMRKFLYGITDEMFAAHRRAILDASSQDLVSVCQSHLKEAKLEGTCLIGPQNDDLSKEHEWSTISH